jgi:hypothetical protein
MIFCMRDVKQLRLIRQGFGQQLGQACIPTMACFHRRAAELPVEAFHANLIHPEDVKPGPGCGDDNIVRFDALADAAGSVKNCK